MIHGRYGQRCVPSTGLAIGTSVLAGGFGLLWMAMAVGMTGGMPGGVPFGMVGVAFPLFGLLFVGAAVAWGVYCYRRAGQYAAAFRAYQDRRAEVIGRNE